MLFIAMLIACLLIKLQQTCLMNTMTLKRFRDDHTSVGIGGAIVRNGMSQNLS